MRKEIILRDLQCADCAQKIEDEVNQMDGVQAKVNLIRQQMSVEFPEEGHFQNILHDIQDIVRIHEPEVEVYEKSEAKVNFQEDKPFYVEHKSIILRLVLGAVLLILAVILDLPRAYTFVLFLASYLIVGYQELYRAVAGIAKGQIFTEHFLMSIATIGAFVIGEYAEAVAVMLFYLIGELFQDISMENSRRSIKSLMKLRPEKAMLLIEGDLVEVSPEEVSVGSHIVVKPGERIPLDGVVVRGDSSLDTSALTGESMPREVHVGDDVLSATMNLSGLLHIRVVKPYQDSTVQKILDLVQDAGENKAKTERFMSRFARYYTPIIVFMALALALLPPLLFADQVFSDWVYRALVFLVISCPCAFVVSVPLSFFAGIGGASKRGILIKGSNYLEALYQVNTVIFDKTGTLTEGEFQVVDSVPIDGVSKEELLETAAIAEHYSNHPIAASIIRHYPGIIDTSQVLSSEEIPGQGVKLQIAENTILVGNHRLMLEHKIQYQPIERGFGATIYVARGGEYMGALVLMDTVKPDARDAVLKLKELGIDKVMMLTGDKIEVAEEVQNTLGLDGFEAELLPQDKVRHLIKIESEVKGKQASAKVLAVGDGINDAPLLARADVGVAMGGLGSDVAIEAADVVIMSDEPSLVSTAVKIARKTRSIVYQNIILALGIKVLFLILGALGIAGMWLAVFADVGVTIIAVLNAMRAMRTRNI